AFINISLLAGGLLVTVPIVLHLIMRQRPKQLIFPALRFIQQRRIANPRQLRMRPWVLLALPCAASGLFSPALARARGAARALSSWMAGAFLAALGGAAGLIAGASLARGLPRPVAGGFAGVGAILLAAALFVAVRALAGRSPLLGDQEAPVAAAIVVDTSPRM